MRRIPGIPPKQWSKELLDATASLRVPPDGSLPAEPPGRPRGMATIESYAHHPALAQAFFPFNGHVLHGTTLTQRLRGMLVLRVAAQRHCDYMWNQHFYTGRTLGLTDDEMRRLGESADHWSFTPLESAALTAVDELVAEGVISDDTWQVLAAELDEQQLLDLIFTIGCYETVTYFMRSLNLEPDPVVAALLAEEPTQGVDAS